MRLEVVKLPQAKKSALCCFRAAGRGAELRLTGRFRRLARDYERLPETLAGLHFLAFVCLLLGRAVAALV